MSERKKPEASTHTSWIALLIGVLTGGALLLPLTRSITPPAVSGWDRTLFELTLGYLAFLFLRAAAHLIFSFGERYFRKRPPEPRALPLVSVILPCFNEEKVVAKAIEAAFRIDYPNLEVIVVDDGSSDETLLVAKTKEPDHPTLRVIHQRNAGKAEALNRGISEAQGDFVLCADSDSLLDPQVIRAGIAYFENHPQLAAVAGHVVVGNRGKGGNILTEHQHLEYLVGLNFLKSAQSFLGAVVIIPGPVGLFRRDVLLACGGYRSGIFAEDCELSLRLLLNGWRTLYCSRMIAVTEAPEDFTSLTKQRYRWNRGMFQAIRAHGSWLLQPWKSVRNFLVMAYFCFETVVIPFSNLCLALLFLRQVSTTGTDALVLPFFLQLTLLDLVITAYSMLAESTGTRIYLLTALNRLTYGLATEILRFFSLLDEMLALPMGWNKLQRRGL